MKKILWIVFMSQISFVLSNDSYRYLKRLPQDSTILRECQIAGTSFIFPSHTEKSCIILESLLAKAYINGDLSVDDYRNKDLAIRAITCSYEPEVENKEEKSVGKLIHKLIHKQS